MALYPKANKRTRRAVRSTHFMNPHFQHSTFRKKFNRVCQVRSGQVALHVNNFLISGPAPTVRLSLSVSRPV